MSPRNTLIAAISLLICFCFALLTACENKKAASVASQKNLTGEVLAGKQLAVTYCSACHLYPQPELLNKESWNNVLPEMKKQMDKSGIQIKLFEWLAIQDSYRQAAPAKLTEPGPETLTQQATIFRKTDSLTVVLPKESAATLVKYDAAGKQFFIGDATGNLFIIRKGELTRTVHTDQLPVDVQEDRTNHQLLVLGLGNFFPSEEMKGKLVAINADGNQQTIADSLKRPVQFVARDFNGNGDQEYLISSFGSTMGKVNSGRLSLFYKQGGKYKEKIIKESPGATKAVAGDFNHDGRLDFMALFAQGKESILLFLNKGNLNFEEKQLLEFPPVYGSNSFDLVDINGDSFLDIIFTNGDNSDYSTIYKPYHGVRIFINNGHNAFQEKYFFHVNGAAKVVARDFDADGDPDLVVLAMFPNLFSRAQETLVYLENEGDLQFKASYLEKTPSTQWFLMDAGDIDQDGDEDIVVGANTMVTMPVPDSLQQKWRKHKISYTAFKNISEKRQSKTFWDKLLGFMQ
ncbi:FG-GAP repeat domain-containing protein [Pontibacter chitinilyticus]|uniref:FG-GAP repeat domain-containing protein n=1 Tax=Pontibacter chitinilyticus TaxID=2674989 RepID=UPI003219D4F6